MIILPNATAQIGAGTWGAFCYEMFLKQYLKDVGIEIKSSFNLTYID